MEELVEPDNICELDIRARMFGWSPSERHALVLSVDIVETVPEAVQRLLMTAKNLIVFSCFHYPFNMVAAQTALSAIELAVRLRSEADDFPATSGGCTTPCNARLMRNGSPTMRLFRVRFDDSRCSVPKRDCPTLRYPPQSSLSKC